MSAIDQIQSSIQPAAGGGNGLLTNLVSYWKCDEASGNATDSHGSNTLTDVNTVTSATGLVYSLARQFTRASAERLESTSSSLNIGDIDFTYMVWINADESTGFPGFMYFEGTTQNLLFYGEENATIYFEVGGLGTVSRAATLNSTWNLVIAWHVASSNQINLSVNNGTTANATLSGALTAGITAFKLGQAGANFWAGRIGPAAFWTGVLTTDQRTALYNSGAGLTYAGFTS